MHKTLADLFRQTLTELKLTSSPSKSKVYRLGSYTVIFEKVPGLQLFLILNNHPLSLVQMFFQSFDYYIYWAREIYFSQMQVALAYG